MSQKLVDRSPDLKRLRDEGFDLQVIGTHVLVRQIPYVTSTRAIRRGVLVSTLEFGQDKVRPPGDHTAWFAGECPCDKQGNPLNNIIGETQRTRPLQDVDVDFRFSSKPSGGYPDYYAKLTTYIKILVHEAQAIDPTVTAKIFPVIAADDENDSPFQYRDTASSRAGIEALSRKLALAKVAIVGLGGTGSYVLDLVAKTHVKEVHLYDDDAFHQHNAFRCPGAFAIEELVPDLRKVDHYKAAYTKLHRGIIAHPYRIGLDNCDELRDMAFVFLCLDGGDLKDAVMSTLEAARVPFIDVGMGVNLAGDGLTGILRVTTSTPQKRDHVRQDHRISFAPAMGENIYSRNIQVADLNALNASLAVIKWKKLFGFYHDLKHEHHSTYVIETNKLSSEDTDAQAADSHSPVR